MAPVDSLLPLFQRLHRPGLIAKNPDFPPFVQSSGSVDPTSAAGRYRLSRGPQTPHFSSHRDPRGRFLAAIGMTERERIGRCGLLRSDCGIFSGIFLVGFVGTVVLSEHVKKFLGWIRGTDRQI